MSDFQRQLGGQADEDRLPWLEPVDDYEDEDGISIGRLIGAVVVGLVALGLIIGGIFWLRNRDSAAGDGSIIAAPDGPIKERPEDAGGMSVEGTGDVAYGASVGDDVNSTIDLSALPEAPITDAPVRSVPLPESKAPAAPAPKPAAAPAKPATVEVVTAKPLAAAPKPVAPKPVAAAKPAPAPSSGGSGIQLGAFSSPALANKAWTQLSGRFSFLAGLDHDLVPVSVNGSTLYRLRANANGQAGTICAKLKVAGEACTVVN